MHLKSLIEELKKREEFWRQTQNDPHGISTAVMVTLQEIREVIELQSAYEDLLEEFKGPPSFSDGIAENLKPQNRKKD